MNRREAELLATMGRGYHARQLRGVWCVWDEIADHVVEFDDVAACLAALVKTTKVCEADMSDGGARLATLLREARQYVSDAANDEDPETQRLSYELLVEIDAALEAAAKVRKGNEQHGSGCSLCDAGCEPTKDWKHATADGWVDCTTEAAKVTDLSVRASRTHPDFVHIEQDGDVVVIPRNQLKQLARILAELASSEG